MIRAFILMQLIVVFFQIVQADPSHGKEVLNTDLAMDPTELESQGTWTDWLNGDSPRGTGDYENVVIWQKFYNKRPNSFCALYCASPLIVEWKLVDESKKEYIDKCLVLDMEKISTNKGIYPGFNCMNSRQLYSACNRTQCEAAGMTTNKRAIVNCDKCPDFKVRYLCPNNDRPINKFNTKALDAIDCDNTKREALDIENADLVSQRMDIALQSLLSSDNANEVEFMTRALEDVVDEAKEKVKELKQRDAAKHQSTKELLRMLLEIMDKE